MTKVFLPARPDMNVMINKNAEGRVGRGQSFRVIDTLQPIVCLAAMVAARDAAGWTISPETLCWIFCLTFAAWGVAGPGTLLRRRTRES